MNAAQAGSQARRALRLGLVGAGRWGRNYIRTLGAKDGAVLQAVASRNPATAALLGGACRIHANWENLLEEPLDGVIVATPPSTHLAIAARFVERGMPVLIEKPLCLDLGEAIAFRDTAARLRVPVVVNHVHLFSPAYRLLKELSPSLGKITGIVSAGGRHGPVRPDTPALWDWGPHDVAMALDLVGAEPIAVSGRCTLRRPAASGFKENYEIELEFAAPVTARIAIGNAMPAARRLEVTHDGGTLVYDDFADRKLAYRAAGTTPDVRVREAIAASDLSRPPLEFALGCFCAAIRTADPDPRQLDLAVGVVRVLDLVGRTAH